MKHMKKEINTGLEYPETASFLYYVHNFMHFSGCCEEIIVHHQLFLSLKWLFERYLLYFEPLLTAPVMTAAITSFQKLSVLQ